LTLIEARLTIAGAGSLFTALERLTRAGFLDAEQRRPRRLAP
jgi:hypothetical protein